MTRRHPLVALVVAAMASLALVAAAGCGSDDADDAVESVESVATGAVDDGTAPGTTDDTATTPGDSGAAPPATTGGSGGSAEVLEIPAAETDLAYQETAVSAPAGTITLRMPNPSAIPHNIAVDEPEQQLGEVVQQGGVSEITVDFPAGEYTYYCSVPGHREAGMEGVLTAE